MSPTAHIDPPLTTDIDRDGRLFRAATPVLERMGEQIAGERLSVMLMDHRASMLTTVNGCRQTQAATEDFGAVPGAFWREDTTGTNALSTAYETRRAIFIRSRHHYLDSLKDFSCYGAPILNPLTGRLEGVLDVMSAAGSESALMQPFVDNAIVEIQQNLKVLSGRHMSALVDAFESAAAHHAAIVVGLSPGITMQSRAAIDMLSPTDVEMLREIAHVSGGLTSTGLQLVNGQHAVAELTRLYGSQAVLVKLTTRQRPFVPRAARRVDRNSRASAWVDRLRAGTQSAVILGEPGTGRSTILAQAIANNNVRHLHIQGANDSDVLANVRRYIASESPPAALAIDDLDKLDDTSLTLIGWALTEGRCQLLATASIRKGHSSELDHVLALLPHRLELPPVRELRDELLDMITEHAGRGVRHRFTAQATQALQTYSWPGNRTELASVVEALAHKRGQLIDLPDLPAYLRRRATAEQLTPWQRASCDAILYALDIMHGNKAHAAHYLGISRSTLYHHIREYGIHA